MYHRAVMRLQIKTRVSLVLLLLSSLSGLYAADATTPPAADKVNRTVIPAVPASRLVDADTMQRIYEEVKTPFKYGVIVKGDGVDELVDSPSIFRHNNGLYML